MSKQQTKIGQDLQVQDTGVSVEKSNKEQETARRYETANLGPLLLKFAVPAIIGMLAAGIQNIVNRIFVGRACGSLALAGVQIGFPVMTAFMAFGMLVGMGSTTLIAIRLGQKRMLDAERILGQTVMLLVLIPVVILIIMWPILDDALKFFGATETVLPYARDYFQIFMFGMICFSLSFGVNNVIRAQGAPNFAMGTQILASCLNVFFNYLFVIKFGFGVRGAALGILLGNGLSLLWIFGFFASKRSMLKVRFRNFRIFPHDLRAVLSLGIAPFFIELANALQQFVMNTTLVAYGGDAAISALSVTMSMSGLLLMPIMGFSQGGQPIMGYNYGAGNFERIKGTLYRAMIYSTIVAIVAWVATMLWAESMAALFVPDEPEIITLSAHSLRLFFIAMPFIPVGVCGGALFQSCGKVIRSTVLSLARQLIFFTPMLVILPWFFGLDGCWLAGPVSDVLAFIATWIFVAVGLRLIKKEMEEKGVGSLVA